MTTTKQVTEAIARATARWPGIYVCEKQLHLHFDALGEVGANLDELALACGCASGDSVALGIFEAEFRPTIEQALAKAGCDATMREELTQQIRFVLLSGTRKILQFSGKSGLKRWLWVLSIRLAMKRLKRSSREVCGDELALEQVAVLTGDPQIEYIRQLYQDHFKEAFKGAVAALSKAERMLLRFHFLESLSIDQIGEILDIHRSTAARRLGRVREKLVTATREQFATRVKLQGAELESLVRLVQSHLHLSMGEVLGAAEAAPLAS